MEDAFNVLFFVVMIFILLFYCWCIRTSRNVRDTSYVYNRDTSRAGYAWNESKSLGPYTLDLHNYSLAAAKIAVPKFIQQRIKEYQSGGSELTFIITGHGKHSVDGPKIKPMVEEYLWENGFRTEWDDHGGRVRVFL